MAQSSSPETNNSLRQQKSQYPDIGGEIFRMYRERYLEQKEEITDRTHSWLEKLASSIMNKLKKEKAPESVPEQKYDELKLSLIAKQYLDANHSELKKENPDTACMIIYNPSSSKNKGEARKICIPRSNPENKTLHINGFSLTPVPKSNGYNTEYEIKDDKGNNWNQLAILFPALNPKFNKKKQIEEKIQSVSHTIQTQGVRLSKIPRTKNTLTTRKQLQGEIERLNGQIVQFRIQHAELGNPEMYVHFSYIPYREKLNTPENQGIGFSYLIDTMKKTYEHDVAGTSLGKIKSNAGVRRQELTIQEALPWQYPLILNLVERMDFELYFDSTGKNLKSQDSIRPLMDMQIQKSLTTFGANKSDAFNWQRSRVGAQGVGQIMPGTYHRFAQDGKYNILFPETDFDIASRDHETSFRLQVAHFDDQIFQFPEIIRSNWKKLISDPKTGIGIIALLSAGYNGSMSRIMREVFGENYKDCKLNAEDCQRKLSVKNIIGAMEKSKDEAIATIQTTNKPRKVYDKKTKKIKDIPPLPLNDEQKAKIQAITARYKESMTYVLKAEYVWNYLKKRYPNQF